MKNQTINSRRPAGQTMLPALACLLAAGSCIGLSVNLVKLVGAAGVGPMPFLVWSIAGASLIVTAVALAFGQRPTFTRRTVEYFVLSGLLSVALPNIMFFSAASRIGVGFVALSFAFPPLYTYLLALLGRIEVLRFSRATGVALGVVGAILITVSKSVEPGADPIGMGLALSAPMIIAAGNIYRASRWPAGVSSLALAPGMLFGALFSLVLGLALMNQPMGFPFGNGVAIALIAVQILAFSTMYILYFILQRLAGAVYMSQVGSVGAITGAAIAILALGETPPSAFLPSALLVAAAVFLVTQTAQAQRLAR